MAYGIGLKLRVTEAALGCTNRKDLCARFRAVNPGTYFDLERAHKWAQGRSLPRFSEVYSDWAKVIGTKRAGAWLAECQIEEFLEEVCTVLKVDEVNLREVAGISRKDAVSRITRSKSPYAYLAGSFVCYSFAWSPYCKGKLIRGSLNIKVQRQGIALGAEYTEQLLGNQVRFEGDVFIAGRTLHLDLRQKGGVSPAFLSLSLPGTPASVLCGIMSGATAIGPEPWPSATRIAIVRTPGELNNPNRYLDLADHAIEGDLRKLGLSLDHIEAANLLFRFLSYSPDVGPNQVTHTEQIALTTLFDRAYLQE